MYSSFALIPGRPSPRGNDAFLPVSDFKLSHHIDPILKFCGVKLRKGSENSEKGAQNYDFAE